MTASLNKAFHYSVNFPFLWNQKFLYCAHNNVPLVLETVEYFAAFMQLLTQEAFVVVIIIIYCN